MALSKAISFLVICFYLLQKMLIYDTISPTPHGKGHMMVVGGGEKQKGNRPRVRPYAHIKCNAQMSKM